MTAVDAGRQVSGEHDALQHPLNAVICVCERLAAARRDERTATDSFWHDRWLEAADQREALQVQRDAAWEMLRSLGLADETGE